MSNPIGMYNIRTFLFQLKDFLSEEGFQVEIQEIKGSSLLNKRAETLKVVKDQEIILEIDATDPEGYHCSVAEPLDRSKVVSAIESGNKQDLLDAILT